MYAREMHAYEVHVYEMYMRDCQESINYLVPMLQDKQPKEEERQKERRWACTEERSSLSDRRERETRIGWAIAFHPLYHSGGTVCVLPLRRDVASGVAGG
jgi:3-phenylpropionate/cinnamic acid dioxygenase small subunit